MNPFFNMMFSFIMADNKAKQYNIADDHEVKTVGLATGIMFDNPILSYLFIDNKAKSVSESLKSAHTAGATVPQAPGLPAPANTTTQPAEPATTSNSGTTPSLLAIKELKSEIETVKTDLKAQMATLSAQMITKEDLEKLRSGFNSFEIEKVRIYELIEAIGERLEKISKSINIPDAATAKNVSNPKSQSKP